MGPYMYTLAGVLLLLLLFDSIYGIKCYLSALIWTQNLFACVRLLIGLRTPWDECT
jgi:hypothetical protein